MKSADDFAAMVNKATVSESKKTVAMNYVRSLRPLENGDAGSVKAQSSALIALAPLILEMYLRDSVLTHEAVTKSMNEAIENHVGACPVGQLKLGKGATSIGIVKAGGYPVALVILALRFSSEIKALFGAIVKSLA